MKKSKKLWFSLAAIAVCAVIMAVVCVVVFAAPSGGGDVTQIEVEKPVNNNTPQGGKLSVKFIREKLETKTYNPEHGYLFLSADGKEKDFTSAKENIFGLDGDKLIGPGCYFTAEMAVSNQHPYAFEYWLELNAAGNEVLAAQLELTIYIGNTVFAKQTLDGGFVTQPLPAVESGQTSRFTAKLEYLKVSENNETQNTALTFNMSVHARLI